MSNLFRVKNGLNLSPVDLTTLTSPQAGDLACDINDSNKIKRYDANTLGWTELGSGGGVGNVNALLTETFDSAALAQFTQTGLVLNSPNPIDGVQSARLIHQPATSQSFKQVIAVDRKYRGELMNLSLQVRSSATSGNLTLLVTDETNSAVIMASSSISTSQYQVATAITNGTTTVNGFSNVDINTLKVGMTITGSGIPTATVINSINTAANTIVISQAATASATITAKFSALPDRKTFSFVIPTNCASLSYTVTALQEAGLPESYVDDVVIELANVSLLETSVTVPNLTAWQGYTPTFQGFGTPSAVEFEWRQNGENVDIRGKFTSGTSTAVEARVGLPAGLTSAGTGLIPSIQLAGKSIRANSSAPVVKQFSMLIQPSVSYFTVGLDDTSVASTPFTPRNGDGVIANGEAFSFFASVPCAGLSASSSVAIPLTQSGLVQEADSVLEMSGSSTIAASATYTWSTTAFSKGSAISYDNGTGRFTVSSTGVYDVTAWITPSSVSGVLPQITKNSGQQLVARHASLASTGGMVSVSASMYLNSGDYFFLSNDNSLGGGAGRQISITYQGSLRQVSVNTNSKITIPTSELRFEGASSRGSTDTAIVKFDTQAKIRGDAFSVVNTAANGTVITMLKAGRLSVSASIFSSGAIAISKNQSNLTSATLPSNESIATASASSGTPALSASCFMDVLVGDIIRIASGIAPTANALTNLNLSFQEQEIQVSVSNTLPQFSESDSCVRLSGAGASPYGSTNLTTRRFANVIQNIGTDIEYTDSATLGGQFVAKAAGLYNVSYSEESTTTAAESSVQLKVNGTLVAFDNQVYNTTSGISKHSSLSWQGYLNIGDIVAGNVSAAANSNGSTVLFTISKVGKPNVTGVNVTPFVNVPQPVYGDASWTGYNGSSGSGYQLFDSAITMNGNSIFAADNTDGNGIKFLKSANITASFMRNSQLFNNSACDAAIYIDGTIVANNRAGNGGTGNSSSLTVTYSGPISAGQVLRFASTTAAPTYGDGYLKANVLATATSDTILTAPETFSTDTASLTYAPSSTYTLSTLANAPVGTFITYTYAINTNTRTQTTTAPTQTTADMNANGMLIYTRAYNAASTAAQPAAIAIQIGKGLKGKSLDLYKSTAKATSGELDYVVNSSTVEYGANVKSYNEITGILIIDFGQVQLSSNITHTLNFSDGTSQASGYLVVNASKNPALTGLGLGTVAAKVVSTSAQSVANTGETTIVWDSTKIYDTAGAFNTGTGVFTVPESGYYQISWCVTFTAAAYTVGNRVYTILNKNGVSGISYSAGQYVTAEVAASSVLCSVGSTGIYLTKSDTIYLTVANSRTAGASALTPAVGNNFLSIHKTSVGTGN